MSKFRLSRRRMRRIATLLILTFVHVTCVIPMPYSPLSLVSAATPAGGNPTVYIVPFQRATDVVTPEALSEVETFYRTLVSMNTTLNLVNPVGAAPTPEPMAPAPVQSAPVTDKQVLKADEQVKNAQSMAAQEKWKAAARVLQRAIRTYEKKLGRLPNIDRLVAAYRLLVQVRFGQRFDDDGEDLLWRLLAVAPDVDLSAFNTPAVEAAVARVRRRLAIPTGTLKVACQVQDCTVSVDGNVVLGNEIKDLARGTHYIQVRAPGYRAFGKVIEAPARGQVANVAARLKKLSRAEAAKLGVQPTPRAKKPKAPVDTTRIEGFVANGDFGQEFLKSADALCRQVGANQLVMGYMNRIGGQYVLAGFVYSTSFRQVAEVSSAMIPLNVQGVQSKMMSWEGRVARSITRFPADRIIVVKPSVYQQRRIAANTPAPVVVQPTTPVPATAPPVPTAPVVTPTPAPSPTVVAPTPSQFMGTKPATAPTAVYQPQPTYRAQPTDRPAVPTPSQYGQAPTAPAPVTTNPVVTPPPSVVRPVPSRPAPAVSPVVTPVVVEDVTEEQVDDETPVYKTWWLWTIVGTVVVGGAVAAGVLLAPSDAPTSFTATATFE